jgi:hypothetical protein
MNSTEMYESKILQLLATVYGPYAFGVASLLLIWYMIVSPQLERQAVDYRKNEEVIISLQQVSATSLEISRALERTSLVLEVLVKELQKVRVDPQR